MRRPQPPHPVPTVLHAVAGDEDVMRVAPLFTALERRGAFRQLVVQAAGDGAAWRPGGEWATALGVPAPARRLRATAGPPGRHAAAVLEGFKRIVLQERPVLVVAAGDDDAVPACALAASRHGVPRRASGRACAAGTGALEGR